MDMEYAFAECWRLYDEQYVVKNTLDGTLKPLYLDIEPMVGFPDTKREVRMTFRKLVALRTLLHSATGGMWHGKTFFRKLLHLILHPFAISIGYDVIFGKMEQLKDRYDFDEKEYVGNMCSSVALWHGMVRREDYTDKSQLLFEGRMYSVPGNYEAYLEPLYGRNCTHELPPESERKTNHTQEIYRYLSH